MSSFRALFRTAQVLLVLIVLFIFGGTLAEAQSPIQITSPTAGAVVYRGSTLQVTFTADSSVSNFIFTGEFNKGIATPIPAANTFSVPIPSDAQITSYQLHVLGVQNGQLISSAAVEIQIESPLAIASINSDLHSLIFQSPGDVLPLVINGVFSDGSSAFINGSALISFVSQNPSIATVDNTGNVSAVAPGTTAITISGASSGVYTVPVVVSAAPAPAPVLSPVPGTFAGSQNVTISDVAPGAALYYTTDGSLPTTKSKLYSGPVNITSTTTLNALAVVPGVGRATAWGTYTINTPVAASPTFSPAAGTFTAVQTVTISDATAGATIYYTTDGTTPTTSSAVYKSPLTVGTTETIQAIAVASGFTQSAVASATYRINIPVVPVAATPTFSPAAGTFTAAQTVSISDATSGAAVYYTTNGTTPTANSTLYSGPIAVSSTETIQAIAVASGYSNSPVASATYTINLPQDFTFGLSASSLSLAPGKSGTLTASVAPVNGFSQPVSFACSGLPSGTACSFSPATVTASGTTTVTITASATAALLTGNRPYEFAGLVAGLSLLFAGRRFRRLRRIGVLLLLMIGVGSAVSCGSGSSPTKATTSTVSINATSGSLTHTASLSLTVQ